MLSERFSPFPEITTDAVLSLDEDSYLLTDEVCMSVVGVGISGSKASPVTTIIARTVGALWCIMILLIDIS